MAYKISPKEKGNICENRAADILRGSGYRILTTNFFYRRFCEVDIIAIEGSCLVGIEVKAVNTLTDEVVVSKLNPFKINKIKTALSYYASLKNLDSMPMRIDAIFILPNTHKLYKNIDEIDL